MVFGSILGGVATGLVGGLLGGNKDGSQQNATQSTSANPFVSTDGLFKTSFQDGRLKGRIQDPRLREAEARALRGAGDFINNARLNPQAEQASFLGSGFMDALSMQDPNAIAESQFNILNPILQKQQEQDFLGLESRLFSQGQLGAGGFSAGNNMLQSLFGEQEDARQRLLYDSLGLGLQQQGQTANLASMFSQLDPTLRQQSLNLGQGFLNIPLQIQSQMLNNAQVAGGLSGAVQSGQVNSPGLSPLQTVGAGLINSGVGGITRGLEGLFQPSTFSGNPHF